MSNDGARKIYLFSVDVEDDRCNDPSWQRFSGRVPGNVERYLEFLDGAGMQCTFFVLGTIARQYPSLVRQIAAAGHEIACHSNDHRVLASHDRKSFWHDLQRNIEALEAAGVSRVSGFRAPCFSSVPATSWLYEILDEFGFRYSSSVIPAMNPLFGWPGFPQQPSRMHDTVWELPISLAPWPRLRVPCGGGVYFRLLPPFVLRQAMQRISRDGRPVIGYLHPHDIDPDQDRRAFPEFADRPFYNWLMFRNRRSVFDKLRMIVDEGFTIMRYDHYVARHLGD
ncbi:MAG: DUF3473 domain-containing protein [Gammaproteobacteria bacterium]|nr:MAG: DUF3473 domain-containing protein [Gammaproteobacteria bacterium]